MYSVTFISLCAVICFIKSVISKDDIDNILSMAKVVENNFLQIQHLPYSFLNIINVDIQFHYSRIGRRSSFYDPDSDCECGPGEVNCLHTRHGKICECATNRVVLNGMCKDCVCDNGVCNGETGQCKCLRGFGLLNNSCVECDCGEQKHFCHFIEGLKFCNCGEKYLSVNEKCEDCICEQDEICIKRPHIGVCICPKGSGTWDDECDDKCDCSGGRDCIYTAVRQICTCMPRKARLDGKCVDCDCGENSECQFVDGEKNCTCKNGYELHNGTCEECFCGNGHSCSFINGSSVCICAENYYEHNGTCKECSCRPNEQCEIIAGEKVCLCKKHFIRINNLCRDCWCGEGHKFCDILNGKKLCFCREGFADSNGTCKKCDCGTNHTCEFQNGNKQCDCNEGYSNNKGVCQRCFCGEDSTCVFDTFGEKICICPNGSVERNGTCTDEIQCTADLCDRGTCEDDGEEIYCDCEDGYSGLHCDEEIILSQGAICLISVLSGVTLFWITLLLVYCVRKQNRYRHYHNEKFDVTMNALSENNYASAT